MSVAHKAIPHTTHARRAQPGQPADTTRAAALGNRENSRPPQVTGTFTRHLWRIQRAMWAVTADKRLRDCHRAPIPAAAAVAVMRRGAGGRGKFAGLVNSHSVWGSPVAAVGIARGRQEELQRAAAEWLAGGKGRALAMVTLTVRHRNGETLEDLLAGVTKAWSRVNSCRAWKAPRGIRRRYGIGHYVWFLEITHGDNGWHPHRHMVMMLERALSDDELAALKAELHTLWADKVADLGLLAPNEAHGVDVKQAATNVDAAAAIATYAAKGMFAGLAAEATGGAVKQARGGNRTPFQILEDIADALDAGEEPNARDVALWREYERATKGKQQRRWSNGALEELAVAVVEDEELEHLEDADAEPDEGTAEDVALVAVARADWWRYLAHDTTARLEVLEAANAGTTPEAGLRAVTAMLDRLGVPYRRLMTSHTHTDPVKNSVTTNPTTAAEADALVAPERARATIHRTRYAARATLALWPLGRRHRVTE